MILALWLRVVVAVVAIAALAGTLEASVVFAAYDYDGVSATTSLLESRSDGGTPDQRVPADLNDRALVERGYDHRPNLARASARPDDYRLAPNTAGSGGRVFTHFTDDIPRIGPRQ